MQTSRHWSLFCPVRHQKSNTQTRRTRIASCLRILHASRVICALHADGECVATDHGGTGIVSRRILQTPLCLWLLLPRWNERFLTTSHVFCTCHLPAFRSASFRVMYCTHIVYAFMSAVLQYTQRRRCLNKDIHARLFGLFQVELRSLRAQMDKRR